ncbi:MAG: thiamine phosphate synthase [Proteobacteria bacterium]|nr:thiamine phosphate synthase [Pseudomonadota bacterium]
MRDAPILCLVTDRRIARMPLDEAVAAAVFGGVDWVQLRERDLEGRDLVELAARVVAAARDAARRRGGTVRVLINRRIDIALAVDADGVHLGYDAMSVASARSLLGAERLIGVSAHAPGEVHAAAAAGANYAHLAPIFAPLSKPQERTPLGIAAIAACGGVFPLLAQGGLEASNAAQAIRAGAAGVAVTGALLAAADPGVAAHLLRATLDGVSR